MQIPPHKSIIPFVGIVETEGNCSLAIEFCPNKTLDDTIKEIQESEAGIEKNDEDSSASETSSNAGNVLSKKATMSWNKMLEISLTVATGIYEMHRVNLIHRDLKSRNLLLDDSFKIKICDFGETCYVKTRLPSQKGTPGWIAPEVQLLECYTTKADVFSYGVLLWQLLTKQQPPLEPFFSGDIFLNSLPYEEHIIGRGIVEVARLCLETEPSKRPSFQFIVQKLLLLEQTPKKLSTSKKKKSI